MSVDGRMFMCVCVKTWATAPKTVSFHTNFVLTFSYLSKQNFIGFKAADDIHHLFNMSSYTLTRTKLTSVQYYKSGF